MVQKKSDMIKCELKGEYLKIFYRNIDDPYSISIFELGESINWRVAESGENKIIVDNVSRWTMHLLCDKDLSIEFAKDFMSIVKKYAPDNEINWAATERAVIIYDEYRKIRSDIKPINEDGFTKLSSDYRDETSKIIDALKRKYF